MYDKIDDRQEGMYGKQEESPGFMGSSLVIFLLGAAFGAAIALLYAPAPGSEIRAQIGEKANQLKDKAGEWKDQAAEKAGEWKEKAMATAHSTMDRAADTMKNAGDSLKNAGDSMDFSQPKQEVKV